MDQASITAHTLLSALRTGDKVILTEDGRDVGTVERPLIVDPYGTPHPSAPLSRSDGAFGSFESTGLVVGWVGGYSTRVQVDHLAGYGRIKAGGARSVPPRMVLQVIELGPASVERHHRITELGAWHPDARR